MEVDLNVIKDWSKYNFKYVILSQYLPPVPRAQCARFHWLAQPHFRSHWSHHLSLRRLSGSFQSG